MCCTYTYNHYEFKEAIISILFKFIKLKPKAHSFSLKWLVSHVTV